MEAAGPTAQNPGHGKMILFSKTMDTGIILSIADMKKQLLRVFKRGPRSNSSYHSTEVERAFLIHFQKWFLNKVFVRIKITKKLKFYAWIVTSGGKSLKKCQKKCLKKPQYGLLPSISKRFLPWLIWYISIVIIWEKKFEVII